MSKDQFMFAHEQLIEEYMIEHPEVDWGTAYEITADAAYNRMVDNLADIGDNLRMQAKERRLS